MQGTRRFWAVVGTAAVLVTLAVLAQRPILLVGGTAIVAWIVTQQYRFTRAITHLDNALTVEQRLSRERVRTDEEVEVSLLATVDTPTSLDVTIRAMPSIALSASDSQPRTVTLGPSTTEARTSFFAASDVAGTFRFDTPQVTVRDPLGLFTERIERGSTPAVTVEARGPRNVHVGEGGDEVAAAYGEHDAGRVGAGITPEEIREYVPGDARRQIDWKTTARLDDLYVREFEAETDRETVLFFDHRAAMGVGQAGETKVDYLRAVALAYVESARALDDPLGCYTVGDGGVTGSWSPSASPNHYTSIRHHVLSLSTTGIDDGSVPSETGGAVRRSGRSPADARRAATALTDDSPYARTLRPYFEAARTYVARIESDPLFSAVKTYQTRLRGPVWTVLFTDDTNRTEVRETVKLARGGENHVIVFLAPSVLFEPGGLGDLEGAYQRYLEFEEFRRDLARLDRVQAYEVAPGDRLSSVLTNQRRRRREA